MTHYFTDNSTLPSNQKEHEFRFLGNVYTFVTDQGVFSKSGVDYGSLVLLEAAAQRSLSGRVLDLGCGYGVLGIVLKHLYPQAEVLCTDVNPRAVQLAQINSERNHVSVETAVSDRFANIPGKFQAIVTNPPIRAGKQVVYGMFQDSCQHLTPGGSLTVVIRRQQGAESAVRKLEELFGSCEILARDRGYWVLRSIRGV